ncbi:phenylalanine--tRNA ligase subunit beta [Prolixibacter denitrificans]|uniref:Phenylalanine--tRNA ligase beta subunit n=1 Tax=Prolixibacter denitrificans TaxID=1541063 RepID=A0A2P8CJH2_9BACT|nr:phenylalanine--tRNA ligase subunit beta [Prolixibacter denitrificans]PSK85116.1 phenylalanyl-tRNA synthetase beta chain [Prolixibacter denitrificans]GET23658.1 phenylalanine--tRNA ligase beta subunit [Prolixibacter denitrificans]
MKLSYTWLKDYIDLDLTPGEVAETLTQLGLEVGSVDEVETVKGGLKGIVIGEVKTCVPHPNSDHLSLTTVDLGNGIESPIVCGAPNVAQGQKVVVATVGTTLYDGDKEFLIKKAKIRGEVSEGMICAEDEIGLGTDHAGIMVLPSEAKVGMPASDYFNVKSDYVIEIDLTPNRIDGASHIGVARDLAAYLKQNGNIDYHVPSVDHFSVDNHDLDIPVTIENKEACPRYSGVTISGITVKESPEWLQNRLRLIGLSPINNIVDITNYVLFETGQPLHAFDAAEIAGNKVIVKTLPAGTKFVTLDEEERELDANDLMICNESEGMCIGGVFGGIKSGVKESTTAIFLESAYFNPVYIRKTARRHGLNTDASFRFERGVDPNNVIYALKRAALLIKELAGGTISSDIVDVVADSSIMDYFPVTVSYKHINRLIGKEIPAETVKSILSALEIKIEAETPDNLDLLVPPYRVDVRREADVIEEILRVYGYNNVEPESAVKSTIQNAEFPDKMKLQNLLSEMLTANGFNEIMSNSLTKAGYYEELESFKAENTVELYNPLSSDLNGMRQTLIFGGMEAVARNTNYRNPDLKLYEFGNVYKFKGNKSTDNPVKNFAEEEHIGLWITGEDEPENWTTQSRPTTFFTLKAFVENMLTRLGLDVMQVQVDTVDSDIFSSGLEYKFNNQSVAQIGYVSSKVKKTTDVDTDVFYGDLNWTAILKLLDKNGVSYTPLPKYPEVRRDLALLLNNDVKFSSVKEIAYKTERKLLRNVSIFDVYEGKNIPEDKKSYAVSFFLRDEEKTLKDKQIDKVMKKLLSAFERELNAQLR